MERGESLSQSFMLLSFTAAALVLSVQLQSKSSNEQQIAQVPALPESKLESRQERVDSSGAIASNLMERQPADRSPQVFPSDRHASLLDAAMSTRQPENSDSSRSPSIRATEAIRFVSAPVTDTWAVINPLLHDTISPLLALDTLNNPHLVIDLSDRQVHAYQRGQIYRSYSIAVGKAGWETPMGEFSVIEKRLNPSWQHPITNEVIPPGPLNPLGSHWIAFWSNGRNKIGFHGTNQSDLIGQAVSHGCVRMHNDDIEEIYDLVEIGTPVIVRQ
ncbi:MAG: L,D-transpeptidase [Elainellaceae cyanobacterium]